MKITTLCYLEKEDQYLMMLRDKKKNDPNQGKWIGVGGHCLDNENIVDCMKREVLEETGFIVKEYNYHGIVTFESDIYEKEVMHLFTSKDFEGRLIDSIEGSLSWIDKKKVLDLNLWAGDYLFLELLSKNTPFFRLKLVYKKDNLIYHDIYYES